MENKKFETLIDLIINENEEQARELFHEIVVEKSREIYENIMDEEMMGEPGANGMVGQVGDLMDEINAEESGVREDEDEVGELGADSSEDEGESDGEDEEVFDLETGDDESEEETSEEEVEDAVIRIEDKLDELMAEFEEIMAGNEAEEEMGGEEGEEEAFGDEEEVAGSEEEVAGSEEAMMEAVELQKVAVPKGGDDGAQKKSPGLQNSGQAGMDSKPVKFSGDAETVPTSPKGPSNFYSKGETQVKDAGSFKNAPGQKGQDLEKAPKPVTAQASGVNTKSVVESRKRFNKKIIK